MRKYPELDPSDLDQDIPIFSEATPADSNAKGASKLNKSNESSHDTEGFDA